MTTATIVALPITVVSDSGICGNDLECCRSGVVALTTLATEIKAGPIADTWQSSGRSYDREERESLDVHHVDCWDGVLLDLKRLVFD